MRTIMILVVAVLLPALASAGKTAKLGTEAVAEQKSTLKELTHRFEKMGYGAEAKLINAAVIFANKWGQETTAEALRLRGNRKTSSVSHRSRTSTNSWDLAANVQIIRQGGKNTTRYAAKIVAPGVNLLVTSNRHMVTVTGEVPREMAAKSGMKTRTLSMSGGALFNSHRMRPRVRKMRRQSTQRGPKRH